MKITKFYQYGNKPKRSRKTTIVQLNTNYNTREINLLISTKTPNGYFSTISFSKDEATLLIMSLQDAIKRFEPLEPITNE